MKKRKNLVLGILLLCCCIIVFCIVLKNVINIFDIERLEGYKANFNDLSDFKSLVDIYNAEATSANAATSSDAMCEASPANAATPSDAMCEASPANAATPSDAMCEASPANAATPSDVICEATPSNAPSSNTSGSDTAKLKLVNTQPTKEKADAIKAFAPGGVVELTLSGNTVVSSEIFKSIQGKDVTLDVTDGSEKISFYGKNITNVKDIDLRVNKYYIGEKLNNTLYNLEGSAYVVEFPSNGTLPGKAIANIKVDKEENYTYYNTVDVYYYNESTKVVEPVAKAVKLTADGVCKFEMTHNSKFIIVGSKVDENLSEESKIVTFVKSNNVYLLLIALAVIVILITVAILIVASNKNKDKNQKS